MSTLSAWTMLLHAIFYWSKIIDTIFWPFAMKAAAERHNALSVIYQNRTPSPNLYGVAIKKFPVKTFHTLFSPVYVLNSRSQIAGGHGPPKWEPRSLIGVYLGQLTFHCGSVVMVFNPSTGRVSPQFHVIFDDYFYNVPYMNAGTTPPNWDDLVLH